MILSYTSNMFFTRKPYSILSWTLIGVCFGLIFPVASFFWSWYFTGDPASCFSMPLFYVIATAPIFLGFFSYLAGLEQKAARDLMLNFDQKIDLKVNELEQTYQILKDNQKKVDAIFESSNDAIMLLDQSGFFDCNRKTLDLFAVPSKEVFTTFHPSQLSPEFQPSGRDSASMAKEKIEEAYKYGSALFEWTHKTLNGQEFPAEVLLSAFEFQNRAVLQASVRDLTQKRQQEFELEMQKKIAINSSKLATLGQLAAGVGHEINNPLSIIKGMVELTEMELNKPLIEKDKITTKLNKMNSAIERIANIVKGLRTFSRSDLTQFTQFNLADLIRETITSLKDLYHKDQIEIELTVPQSEELFLGNKGRIQQVLINLVSNAKDAIEHKEIRKISVELVRENAGYILTVTDTGMGIPAEIREKIFEPFFTTKEVNRGTGIGLSLVDTIVKEHEGKIEVASEVTVGTKFQIFFPIKADFNQPAKNYLPDPLELNSDLNLKILFVDDEPDFFDIFEALFVPYKCMLTFCSSGKDALVKLEQQNFDLVVSDIKMPQMNGIEMVRLLRKMKHIRQPKVILITGGVDIDLDRSKFSEYQVDNILSKPFDEIQLLNAIKKATQE
jgi:PAS domain S-box-containing protein